ncbi:MAG: hypothetical protein ACYDA5_04065 [Vulcanimicrobiaceae bacterium]
MSQPSRSERRRRHRGGASPNEPRRRDPMLPIYIGFGVVMVLIFAGFGVNRWVQTRRLVAAYATPTPGPNASQKPIQLTIGEMLGKKVFPRGERPTGGLGQPVDGIKCGSGMYVYLHIHTHLALYDNGVQIRIPRYLGMAPTPTGGCLYWIHTHDASGVIHVEAPKVGKYVLGDFFAIWGEPLSRTNIGGFKGPVTAYVNGALYTGKLSKIPLLAHQQIVLEVGKPIIPPPNYAFPPGE